MMLMDEYADVVEELFDFESYSEDEELRELGLVHLLEKYINEARQIAEEEEE
jgi:hypothetical protein